MSITNMIILLVNTTTILIFPVLNIYNIYLVECVTTTVLSMVYRYFLVAIFTWFAQLVGVLPCFPLVRTCLHCHRAQRSAFQLLVDVYPILPSHALVLSANPKAIALIDHNFLVV